MVEATDNVKKKSSTVFEQVAKMGHEQVVYCYDEATGLKAIVAIHNTVLGPAMGGTRMWNYASEEEALTDVLRLSRGMTFKSAIGGLNIGGGKAVIIGDVHKLKNEAFMRRFGRFIHGLGGRYFTAEDVNMTEKDMEYIRMETPYVTGISTLQGGSGDPSPVTAYGIYMGMKASAKKVFGNDSLENKKISIQGVGKVGGYLLDYLVKEKADLYISDIYQDRLENISRKYPVTVVSQEEIYDLDVDIYSPCALGATLNDETIPRLKCQIIAGGANNQLADEEEHGLQLIERGITYAPDFLINGGGIANVYFEYLGDYKKEVAMNHTEKIYNTCLEILNRAEDEHITPQAAAMKAALERIQKIGALKASF